MTLTGPAAAVLLFCGAARTDDAKGYLQSAHQLERTHDYRGAEIQLRNAAQAAPGNGAIRLELAQMYLKLGNPNAAQAELFDARFRGVSEEALAPLMAQSMLEMGQFGDLLKNVRAGNRAAKTESLVRTYRGTAETALGEVAAAHSTFSDAERLDPKSPLPLIGEARLLMQQHDFAGASKRIDMALALDPKNADAIDAKGLILALRRQPDAAMKQFVRALAIDPGNLRARLDRANLSAERGHLQDAEKDLQVVQKIAPGSVMALYLQAAIDAQKGNYKKADALLDRLRGAMSGFPPAYLIAAQVKFKLNQLDQAEAFTRKFIAHTGDQSRGYQLLGAIALKRGDLEGGIAALEKATQLVPNDANALAALGQVYVAHGDLDKAKVVFDEAALKAPGNAPLATERALTQFATGDREASVAALSDIFKGGKGSIFAGPPLVIEALQSGQLDLAEVAARELVGRDSANPTYQELLAAVRIAQRDYGGAEILLRGLIAKHPDLPSARRDLAQVYVATNRLPEAEKLYQDRLRAHPNDLESLEALAGLAFRHGADAGAIRLLTQAQAAAPATPGPSLRIVAMLQARKKWPEAIARTRALQAKFGKDATVADALANLYFQSGNHAASAAAYKTAAGKFPASPAILAHYAAVLAADRKYADAAPLALRAVRLDPRSSELKRLFVSLTYLAKGADAALAASRSVTIDKTETAAVLMTADVLEGNRNRAAAISLLEVHQAQRPSSAVVVRLAGLYQRDAHLEKAGTLLESWSAAHPDDVDAKFALAQVESVEGKFDQALSRYEWVVSRKPDNPVILNNLAWLYDRNHDARALPTAEKAMKLAPASGSVADTLGWILLEKGDTGRAVKYLSQASASQPADGSIQYHYAVALSKTGQTSQARLLLKKALAAKPDPNTVNSARILLASLGTH
jgi:putative PEP-CTERM system TPR-repeat lipoprotein